MTRPDAAWLGAALALAAAVGAVNLVHQPGIEPDGTDYVLVGRSILSGHGYPRTEEGRPDLQFPPLFPVASAAAARLCGDLEMGGRLASLASHLGLVVVVFLLARRLAGATAGRWAALFSALAFSGHATIVASEPTYTLCVTGGTALVAAGLLGGGLRVWGLAGAAFGCAYVTRIEGFLFVVLGPALALLRPAPGGWRWRAARAGLFALTFLVVASPYLRLLRTATGRWTAGTKFATVLVQSEAVAGPGVRSPMSLEELDYGLSEDNRVMGRRDRRTDARSADSWAYLRRHAREVMVRYASNTVSLLWTQIPQTLSPFFAAFAGIGLIALAARPDRAARLTALGWPFLAWLAYPLARVEPRFLVPQMPFVMVLAGAGVEGLGAAWSRRGAAALAAALVAAVMPQALMPTIAARWRPDKQVVAPETKEVGRWLRDHGGSGALVMARRPVIPFYAESRFMGLPYAAPERALAFAAHHDVRFLVIEEDLVRAVRPQLAGWLEETARLPGWRAVYRLERRPGYRYVVWEKVGRG